MTHLLTASETIRRWMRSVASDALEHEGSTSPAEELAEHASEAYPGHLDLLDLEDLAHEVLDDLRRNPPGRARLVT